MSQPKIIVFQKRSKYELDLDEFGLAHDELMLRYDKEGIDKDRMFDSHKAQKENLRLLKKYIDEKNFFFREDFTKKLASDADFVISFGGDNHFQYVSQFLNSTPIIGINSDPERSRGALYYNKPEDIETILESLERKRYDIEEWTRLEVGIDNKKLERLATTEVFLGEDRRKYMSRYVLEFKGKKEEQKSSGIIVSVGSGSTGWYSSATNYLHKEDDTFSKTIKIAKFIVTEPSKWAIQNYSMLEGILHDKDKLIVHSFNDDKGVLTLDCEWDYDFMRRKTASIGISEYPLKVVKIKKLK